MGLEGENPAVGVKMFKETKRDRFLHPEELKRLFDVLEKEPRQIRSFILIALYTGARRSNIHKLCAGNKSTGI